jgi:hypothetical protein
MNETGKRRKSRLRERVGALLGKRGRKLAYIGNALPPEGIPNAGHEPRPMLRDSEWMLLYNRNKFPKFRI